MACTHLDTVKFTDLPDPLLGCEECLKKPGSWWVHLRMCLECGKVGCCDNSPNKHATAHFHESAPPADPLGRAGRGVAVVLRRRGLPGLMPGDWPELPYEPWRDTRDTLHMYLQIVGKVRLALAPMEPQWAQVPLYVTARGLNTSPIPHENGVFDIDVDLIAHAVSVRTAKGALERVPARAAQRGRVLRAADGRARQRPACQ